MDNKTAFLLLLALGGATFADWHFNDGENLLFLGRKGVAFLELLAFWR